MTRLAATLALIAAAWGISSVGYFWLTPIIGVELGYNDAPIFFSAYYAIWAALVFLVFRRSFLGWARFDAPEEHLAIIVAMLIAFSGFSLYIIPRLPVTEWPYTETPVEFFWAEPWYFLPKSIEILFQQILIAALILALYELKLSLARISIAVAVLFGGFHLSLALNSDNPVYVFRYSVAATIFGAIAPYIIIRFRNGFLISYSIHWVYYAIDISLIHFYFSAK